MSGINEGHKSFKLNTIKEAIEDIKAGKVVIVVDDEDRENEGDFVAAAEKVTPQMINFMATHGRGLICAPITEDRSKELGLNLMVDDNTVLHNTQFTVSVDLIGHGCTTGISTHDRAKTIKALTEKETKPEDLGRPGHIFPLRAKNGGVLRRTGHTEASIDLARLAGLQSAGILVEILNEDGSMARLPQLMEVAKKFNLKIISIEDLVAYRMQHDSLIVKEEDFDIKTRFGEFRLRAFKQTTNNQIHIALTKGAWTKEEEVLVRMNSTLVNNDILDTLMNDADKKLDSMFKALDKDGKGAVVFINPATKPLSLLSRLAELKENQKEGTLKAPQPSMDNKDFGIGAQILHDLGIHKIKLLSNSKQTKRVGMIGYGLEIVDYVNY
ncbi:MULTISPECIES: 3,4-dihydroxy-2-butanone-4-phosphate synthase [Zunongwangia]|uniref:3,4-dihydroxy-2-butanone 4-phosphate synthase n=1 Tax=Zunongwangia profunda (strain DSM 18752 / CCTCC AB 206139 / SM-A87) TaxID=655815 RepID=D5BG71_ZUNPS|nr:3,4-dihydroxy-2-butanone-4-phosphate synthase [Zunongwangia profunda]ADF53184.1 bifunctional protein: GTP cyclohydrolase II; 3,4 dihydroxy-2-butanone-4-phosphate synthase [Zunongwangia profunda SM-A87]MAG88375.1 3,4-dihydroxy-2-butanone-4-phosphate synthase [Flavobacteriaceae bacterium]MAS69467.1 3,4-dihydroxy-2-butanone-4-phosphate synthase [Zunongwangia sp.]HAJ81444.1 3,4-dihydroxy-2-butanone-4-phosphate synthase [Zunongwangia profunda]|tara:strand:+ start:319 stop:1467 length:1149 start_codon:yes stop_codon:yes gene_type:complete